MVEFEGPRPSVKHATLTANLMVDFVFMVLESWFSAAYLTPQTFEVHEGPEYYDLGTYTQTFASLCADTSSFWKRADSFAKSLVFSGQATSSAPISRAGRCGVMARGFISSCLTRSSIQPNKASGEGLENGFVYQHLLMTFQSISFKQPAAFGYSGFKLGTTPLWIAPGTRWSLLIVW